MVQNKRKLFNVQELIDETINIVAGMAEVRKNVIKVQYVSDFKKEIWGDP